MYNSMLYGKLVAMVFLDNLMLKSGTAKAHEDIG